MRRERIVAVGLLTEKDLAVLGAGFKRAYAVRDDVDFTDLLKAIDVADAKRRKH